MIRRPPRSTLSSSSAASDVYKRQVEDGQGVRGGVARELLVGGIGQLIEIGERAPWPREEQLALGAAVGEPRDVRRGDEIRLEQFQKRLLPFANHDDVQRWELAQQS